MTYSTTGEPTAETETDRDLPALAKAAGRALGQSMRKTARQETGYLPGGAKTAESGNRRNGSAGRMMLTDWPLPLAAHAVEHTHHRGTHSFSGAVLYRRPATSDSKASGVWPSFHSYTLDPGATKNTTVKWLQFSRIKPLKTCMCAVALVLLAGCFPSISGEYKVSSPKSESGFIGSIKILGSTTVAYSVCLVGCIEATTSYRRDGNFIHVKTDKADLVFEVKDSNTLVGQNWIERGTYTRH